jgi:hypothetical protein
MARPWLIIIIMKILESTFERAREEAAILSRTRTQRAVASCSFNGDGGEGEERRRRAGGEGGDGAR